MTEHTHRFLAWPGAPLAIASAARRGASTPFAKLLVGTINPWLLAALLYLGSGLGLAIIALIRTRGPSSEAALAKADIPWLALIVLFGGIAAPVLLMIGLASTPAASTALLLNLEGLATMAIAWIVFRENVDTRLLVGAFAILGGAALLSWQGRAGGIGPGALAIAGACLAWGIDNNLTRKLSAADPVQIAMIKGLAAGATNLVLAWALGAHLPPLAAIAGAGLTGFLGYGISLVLFVLALRHLGTARTGAYFSTAPFIGAVLAIALLHEPFTVRLAVAGALMALGLYLHLSETHDHAHSHEALDHEHAHVHDEHHRHAHDAADPPGEPHTHRHHHEPLSHSHPHYPDLHHRHNHA